MSEEMSVSRFKFFQMGWAWVVDTSDSDDEW